MLADRNAMATIAVKDMDRARGFYGGTLGLTKTGPENGEVQVYKSGSTTIVVYRSDFAGTNKATSATWGVGEELNKIVVALKRAGVKFEHYDMAGGRREGDVHVFGDFRAAWFKDPDGNILHINSSE
jgi:catechol 2,3-dioxygenase-like lactoylglutathione lyase family enzyme